MNRILLTGKIECGGEIQWHVPPLPVEVQTDEPTKLVSRYMNRHGFLDMQSNYFMDGWYARIEEQPLAAMPTEYHEAGWFAAKRGQGEKLSELEESRLDEDFNRRGGW